MKIDMMNQGAGNEAVAHENATTTNALKATHYKSPPPWSVTQRASLPEQALKRGELDTKWNKPQH